jgi:hypothetical protein
MKKAEFIGYLYALKDLAVDDTFDDFDDGVEWILDKVIERAKQLDEPVTATAPSVPPVQPYGPFYMSTDSDLFNVKYPEPNEWKVNCDKAPDFTVIK